MSSSSARARPETARTRIGDVCRSHGIWSPWGAAILPPGQRAKYQRLLAAVTARGLPPKQAPPGKVVTPVEF